MLRHKSLGSSEETGWKIPPLVFKRSETRGGILHNGGILVKKFDYFPTVLDLWVLKKFACGAIKLSFPLFSRVCVDCGTISIVLETTTSKCGLSATDESSSEYFRYMVDDL